MRRSSISRELPPRMMMILHRALTAFKKSPVPGLGQARFLSRDHSCDRVPKDSPRKTEGFLKKSPRRNGRGITFETWPNLWSSFLFPEFLIRGKALEDNVQRASLQILFRGWCFVYRISADSGGRRRESPLFCIGSPPLRRAATGNCRTVIVDIVLSNGGQLLGSLHICCTEFCAPQKLCVCVSSLCVLTSLPPVSPRVLGVVCYWRRSS